LFFCATIFFAYDRIGIRDIDSYAYTTGAMTLKSGFGYKWLTGEVITHWPPGFSLLLSCFDSPIHAGRIINFLCFGLFSGAFYTLARLSHWSWQASLGLCLILGSGFFRLTAATIKPDVFTYFAFTVALLVIRVPRARLVAYIVWGALIPIKLVAVVFIPAALLAEFYLGGMKNIKWRIYVAPILIWIFFLMTIFYFNFIQNHEFLPSSHSKSSEAR
jgi:hypothetical protein